MMSLGGNETRAGPLGLTLTRCKILAMTCVHGGCIEARVGSVVVVTGELPHCLMTLVFSLFATVRLARCWATEQRYCMYWS